MTSKEQKISQEFPPGKPITFWRDGTAKGSRELKTPTFGYRGWNNREDFISSNLHSNHLEAKSCSRKELLS